MSTINRCSISPGHTKQNYWRPPIRRIRYPTKVQRPPHFNHSNYCTQIIFQPQLANLVYPARLHRTFHVRSFTIFLFVIGQIFSCHIEAIAIHMHLPIMNPYRFLAQGLDVKHTVRAQQQCPTLAQITFDPANAFFLERFITHSQHFVSNQNIRLHGGCHGKTQPNHHARRVMLDRFCNMGADISKFDYRIQLAVDFCIAHTHQRGRQMDIFQATIFGVKTAAQLQ